MFLCSILLAKRPKSIPISVCAILSLFLLSGAATGVAAITAREIVENAIDVYEDIDNYTAVVETYETDSMQASPSIFESQPPITAFNLFFRKPDEHAVEPIVDSRQGIFRVEPISALGNLRDKELNLEAREVLRGKNCYVVACASPDEPGTLIKLWISPRDWTIQQFTLIVESLPLANTQFRYPPGGNKRLRFLPTETRSFFPLSKKVLINRITDYRVNTSLPSDVFKNNER